MLGFIGSKLLVLVTLFVSPSGATLVPNSAFRFTSRIPTHPFKHFKRRLPLRNAQASTPDIPVANIGFIRQEMMSALNKYANASDILSGIGLTPQGNFSVVDEYTSKHTWDEALVPLEAPPLFADQYRTDSTPSTSPTGQWPLTDFITAGTDILYYGSIRIGTSVQTFDVDIDTGSSDLWVQSHCNECKGKQYNGAASTSYSTTADKFHVGYGSGYVCGILSTDVVEINGYSVQKQHFGAVNSQTKVFHSSPTSGLLGLAFGSISTSKKLPFFESLLKDASVSSPYFGVHLTRGQRTGSQLCLGCVDTTKWTGEIFWIPVISKTYWTVAMNSLRLSPGGRVPVDKSISAVIDTGSSLIYMPSSLARRFYSQIPGSQEAKDLGEGIYTFPCSSRPSIDFEFNHMSFTMPFKDFVRGRIDKSQKCVGGILGMGSTFPQGLVVIGDIFLKNWYSIYDYSHGARVGLAASINNIQK